MKPIFSLRMRERWLSVSRLTSWPSKVYRPPLNSSSRPATLRNVVLPEPEWPVIATNSPGCTFRLKLRRACVSTTSVRNTLPTLYISIMYGSRSVRQVRFGRARKVSDARHDNRLALLQARDDLHLAHTHGTEDDVTLACSVTVHDVHIVARICEGAALHFQCVGTLV